MTYGPSRLLAVAAVLVLTGAITGCSGGNGDTALHVSAASSLTEAFTALERQFERQHPDVDVQITFDSSSTLAEQVAAGAPVDVLATADGESMRIVTKAGDADGPPRQFTTNTLMIVTPPDNPAHVTSIHALADADFVMCDVSAPCGAAAQQALHNAGVHATPKSYEENVKSVLSKVTLGEVDAGIVYVSDARAAGGQVHAVPIPPAVNVVNPYFIATIKGADQPRLAAQWTQLVRSPVGRKVLTSDGFGVSPA